MKVPRADAAFLAVLVFFFASGATALLYQVVWTRKLVLLFGTASYAVSTVLSIFFLGLALGSIFGGRIADRIRRPLFAYGIAELLIGVWAALFIVGIDAGESLVVAVLQSVGGSRPLAIALRALLGAAFLIVPVTLMGATLPLLARFVTRTEHVSGFRIGALYSINTVGAVLGTAAAGFILIEHLGYSRATYLGAVLNLAIGVVALALSRLVEQPAMAPAPESAQPERVEVSLPLVLVFVAFAISGFCALALEVIWTRLLGIVFLGTTYAFTTMLCTVLFGIAVGSACAALFVDRRRHFVALFGLVQVITAVSVIVLMSVFPALPDWFRSAQRDAGFDWTRMLWVKFTIATAVLLPPTFFFGMSFPLAIRAAQSTSATVGRAIGRLYGANTLGGVIGAAVGGFVLIPQLGAHDSIVLLAAMLAVSGIALVLVCPTAPRALKGGLTAAGIAASAYALTLLPPDISRALNRWFIPEGHEMIHYAEGVEGTVVVTAPQDERHGTGRYLWINAVQATASIEKGVKMNRFQGMLPLLYDRDPERALFMCFGSGVTAGTLALSPFERIDTVEISRDVLDAAPLFAADNLDVVERPNIHPIIDDGRNYLLTTKQRYDLITFEPMPLALAGVSTFYTREYYELCYERLTDRGLVSQWIPFHSLEPALVRSLVKTFIDAFPYAHGWFINADLFVIGSNAPLAIDYEQAQQRLEENPALREALAEVYLPDVEELFAKFVMTRDSLAAFAGDAPIMRDDRPWAEFLAPRLIYERHVAESIAEMEPHVESPVAVLADREALPGETVAAITRRHAAHVHDFEGLKEYYTGTFGSKPDEFFRESLAIDPNDYNAHYYLSEILFARGERHARWDEPEEAERALLESLHYNPKRLDTHLALGDFYYAQGRRAEAAEHYRLYAGLGGMAPHALERTTS